MYQLRLLWVLMKPSLFSFIAGTLLAAALLFIFNAPYILGSAALSSWLGTDPKQLSLVLEQLGGDFDENKPQIDTTFLDLPVVYNVVIVVAALVAGILVYIALETLTKGARNVRDSIAEISFAKNATIRESVGLQVGARLALRLGALVGGISYATFWFGVVLPYCVSVSQLGLNESNLLLASLYLFASLVLLGLSIHVHVIFLRLLLLRPRVFGGEA